MHLNHCSVVRKISDKNQVASASPIEKKLARLLFLWTCIVLSLFYRARVPANFFFHYQTLLFKIWFLYTCTCIVKKLRKTATKIVSKCWILNIRLVCNTKPFYSIHYTYTFLLQKANQNILPLKILSEQKKLADGRL